MSKRLARDRCGRNAKTGWSREYDAARNVIVWAMWRELGDGRHLLKFYEIPTDCKCAPGLVLRKARRAFGRQAKAAHVHP